MTVLFRSLPGSAGLLAGCALALTPAVALAQTAAPSSSQAEAQPAADAGRMLANAMSRLASSPRDTTALIDAGEAALKLDDPRSAIGFFGRADDVSPNNGRVKAGLGRAMLALGQTGDGLRLMEQAATLRYSDLPLLIDRGLARDLSGNQAGAQRDYQEALQRDPDNAVALRRYAVSLGISGQVDMAERTLQPLLYKNDRAAWRDRAFILAMNGRTADALDITSKTMPPALADAIKPYIERMAMLTSGQRAAAVHMGQFPAGLVNVRVASTAVPASQPSAAVEPADRKSGRERQTRTRTTRAAARESAAATRVAAAPAAPSAPTPVRATPASATATPAPVAARPVAGPPADAPPTGQSPASQPSASPALQPAPVVRAAAPPPPASPPPASPPVTPRVDLRPATAVAATPREPVEAAAARQIQGPPAPVEGAVQTSTAPAASSAAPAAALATPAPTPATAAASAPAPAPAAAPAPASMPTPAAPAESTRSLAEIMAEISIPEAERRQDVVPVNLAEIAAMQAEKRRQEAAEARARKAAEAKEAARRRAEAEAKAKAEAEKKRLADNPARYWVQIGVGRDKGALAFTLRRMKKEHAALARYDGWSAGWGQTNRLVVGPFPNLAKAKAVEADMKKAGSDAFVWRSDAGEEVDRIGG